MDVTGIDWLPTEIVSGTLTVAAEPQGCVKEAVPSVAMRPDTVTCDANTWRLAW